MTLHDYLLQNLPSTVMIHLSVVGDISFQYNYWNWFHQIGQLHLLQDDYSIGHILHSGIITQNEDGSILYQSEFLPKQCQINFYFGTIVP